MAGENDGLRKEASINTVQTMIRTVSETQKRNYAYLSLGSNSSDGAAALKRACEAIAAMPEAEILSISPIFLTEPQEYKEQNWFYNLCLKASVRSCTAEEFLDKLLKLEISLGRERKDGVRFGPRAIDIDLLLFGGEKRDDPALSLPHPRMHKRAFVLLPLYLIEPRLVLYGESLAFWLGKINWKLDSNRIYQS